MRVPPRALWRGAGGGVAVAISVGAAVPTYRMSTSPHPETARLGTHPKDISTPIHTQATGTGRHGSAIPGGGKWGQWEHPQLGGWGAGCAEQRQSRVTQTQRTGAHRTTRHRATSQKRKETKAMTTDTHGKCTLAHLGKNTGKESPLHTQQKGRLREAGRRGGSSPPLRYGSRWQSLF